MFLWLLVSLGVTVCGLLLNLPSSIIDLKVVTFCWTSSKWGEVVVCFAVSSSSSFIKQLLKSCLDSLPAPTTLIFHFVPPFSLPPAHKRILQSHPTCLCCVDTCFFFLFLCRSAVCGLPTQSQDSHLKPSSYATRGQAHDFWIPPAAAGVRRHQSGVLP